MAVGKHFDDTPLTLTTMDEQGNMAVYDTELKAQSAMKLFLLSLAAFRFKPANEIDHSREPRPCCQGPA